MPQPTTRIGRFVVRRRRYLRRLERQRRSYPSSYLDGHGDPVTLRPNGPWILRGDGPMQTQRSLIGNTIHGFQNPAYPLADVRVSTVGYQLPPHVSIGPFGHPPFIPHRDWYIAGYHMRAVNFRGHKLNRMTGYDRQVWFATQSARLWQEDGGTAYFPEWDPLHRTPIDIPYWDL